MPSFKDKILTEDTHIKISIGTAFLVLGWIISTVAIGSTWKSDMEHNIYDNSCRIETVEELEVKHDVMLIDTKTRLAEIQTDLK